MGATQLWSERFKKLFINNRFVLFLLILLLIGLNIFVFTKISFVFTPVTVLLKTVLLPILLTGAIYYLLNPLVDWLEGKESGGFTPLPPYIFSSRGSSRWSS
ncbi:hypothetical protein HMSSN036_69270 [Paenibacillus macerans]|nr:hypothetical protein HMSSN036_69270 [Paenibacillus macerans]